MTVDLPPLTGAKLQQALASVLGDRLSGGGPQHYAAGPLEHGRIRLAAACDAAWLKLCLDTAHTAGLHTAQVVPEACLLPQSAAWWGQLQTGEPPAWLVRAANGEAVRVAAPALAAVTPAVENNRQWFADPACEKPALPDGAACAALSRAALLRAAATSAWDLRQFAFALPGGAARFMRACAGALQQRSGRFALAAVLALLAVNVLGLNLYALKHKRDISARHAEMERIVTQALPGAPRVLEPALQLEAAWQRARNASGGSGAGLLLSLFAQSGSAPALTALDVSERALRATFADSAALQRHAAACDSAALRSALQRAGVRCTREGERLLLDFSSDAAAAGLKG